MVPEATGHVRVCGSNESWFGFLPEHSATIAPLLCGNFPQLCRCKNQRAKAAAGKPRTPEFEPKSPTYPPHLTSAVQPNITHYTVSVNFSAELEGCEIFSLPAASAGLGSENDAFWLAVQAGNGISLPAFTEDEKHSFVKDTLRRWPQPLPDLPHSFLEFVQTGCPSSGRVPDCRYSHKLSVPSNQSWFDGISHFTHLRNPNP